MIQYNTTAIMHNVKVLTYAVNNNNIKNINKDIIKTGIEYLNNYLYDFVSIQHINKIFLSQNFIDNYINFNTAELVTLINKELYNIESTFLNDFYHVIILSDKTNYININNVIYINVNLKNETVLLDVKQILDKLDKNKYKFHRVILTGFFNTIKPEQLIGFNNLLEGFANNNFNASKTSNNSHIFDNYNKFLDYKIMENFIISTLEMITLSEIDFLNLEIKYKKLINYDYIISNINDLSQAITEFKEGLRKFETMYPIMVPSIKEKYDAIIFKIDQVYKIQQDMKLFNKDNDNVQPVKIENTNIFKTTITNIRVFGNKQSSSDSVVFKAYYNGKPCFIKMFSIDNASFLKKNYGLEYEFKIYKYLMEKNNEVQQYFKNYFVNVYDVFKVDYYDFFSMIDYLNTKIEGGPNNGKIFYSKTKTNAYNKILPSTLKGYDSMLYFTVTEDIQGETYNDFFNNNISNENIIIETIFDIVYAIYLLNNKLGIIHGDNHFGNILIKPEQRKQKYIIGDIVLERDVNYRICLYDFDLSYMIGNNNLILDEPFNISIGRINNNNFSKDIWTILNSLMMQFNIDFTKTNSQWVLWYKNMQNNLFGRQIHSEVYYETYMYNLVNKVFLQSDEEKNNLYKNFLENKKNGTYWNSFCNFPITTKCTQPIYDNLCAKKVLFRYITEYKNVLNFNNIISYHKKYLKYKNKYKQLKNKKNDF